MLRLLFFTSCEDIFDIQWKRKNIAHKSDSIPREVRWRHGQVLALSRAVSNPM